MFCNWKFALSNIVIMLFVSVVVSMEINRRHYFWSSHHTSFVLGCCSKQLIILIGLEKSFLIQRMQPKYCVGPWCTAFSVRLWKISFSSCTFFGIKYLFLIVWTEGDINTTHWQSKLGIKMLQMHTWHCNIYIVLNHLRGALKTFFFLKKSTKKQVEL